MTTKGVEDGMGDEQVTMDRFHDEEERPTPAMKDEVATTRKMVNIEYPTYEQCYERAIGLIHKLRPPGCFGDEEGDYGELEFYVMALKNPHAKPPAPMKDEVESATTPACGCTGDQRCFICDIRGQRWNPNPSSTLKDEVYAMLNGLQKAGQLEVETLRILWPVLEDAVKWRKR